MKRSIALSFSLFMMLMLIHSVALAQPDISEPVELDYIQYIIASEHQAYPNSIRILEPDNLDEIENPRIVYVLPVNPDVRVQWNDGLDTFKQLDLHNQYGMIAVAPSFSNWPWFADHPEDAALQQETYFVEDVVPFIDSLYPEASETRLLLGFSKSGNGAFQLLLRHPDLFWAASVWDTPLMKESPDQFEMPDIYGTQENFDSYYIPTLLEENADLLKESTRLALFGYGFFGGPNPPEWTVAHVDQAHELLESLEIPHIYDNSTEREHRWDSGWMEAAVAALDEMSQQ